MAGTPGVHKQSGKGIGRGTGVGDVRVPSRAERVHEGANTALTHTHRVKEGL